MKTSPLQQVKGNFGDKAKLISAVQALATDALWLDRVNKDKGLAKISNSKLIRLHAALSRAKEQFGSREKLIATVLAVGKRNGDDGYEARLATYPLPRLLDLHDSLRETSGQKARHAKATSTAQRKARSKKAKLKAA